MAATCRCDNCPARWVRSLLGPRWRQTPPASEMRTDTHGRRSRCRTIPSLPRRTVLCLWHHGRCQWRAADRELSWQLSRGGRLAPARKGRACFSGASRSALGCRREGTVHNGTRQHVPTILDAIWPNSEVFEVLLPLADHAIFSSPALEPFQPIPTEAALERISSYGCRVAAVTRGAEGVVWRQSGSLHEMRAQTVDIVDTTGAGDVFHGAYALAVGAGLCPQHAMSFASAAAAIKCARPGGRAGIPSLADCLAFKGSSQ